ncbi:MAG TPA: hypothetical protein VK689_06435 [Armatimonadota bacterium]|nr:hypothetical protein [Armatimonadota bacterium]
MWKSVLKVAVATAAWAVLHSVLASRPAKDTAARLLGQRRRDGLYRPFYVVQSVVTLGALAAYVWPLPDRVLYRARGPLAWLMLGGQTAAAIYALWAAREVGLCRMLGVTSLAALLEGGVVVPEPEAQGPALAEDGGMRATGPFAWSRHPLNLAPVPVLWLWPTMTAKLAAFNGVATLYFILGSRNEEARLRDAYGPAYAAYQQSGVPFYLPRPLPLPTGESAPPPPAE